MKSLICFKISIFLSLVLLKIVPSQYVIYSYNYFSHSLDGNKNTTAKPNSINLSYLGSFFLAIFTVSNKTLTCIPLYSLKLISVPFAFRLRAHLSSVETLSVALVKDHLAQVVLVISSHPSYSWSTSACRFVEVNVT